MSSRGVLYAIMSVVLSHMLFDHCKLWTSFVLDSSEFGAIISWPSTWWKVVENMKIICLSRSELGVYMMNKRFAPTYWLKQHLCRVSEDEWKSKNNCCKRHKWGQRIAPIKNEETCKENTEQCNANKDCIQLCNGWVNVLHETISSISRMKNRLTFRLAVRALCSW